MIKVGIIGATGYAGEELVRILTGHPEVQITEIVSKSFSGQKLSDLYPTLRGVVDGLCGDLDVDRITSNCDLVFTALPHGASSKIISELAKKNVKIIDLSADFRYKNLDVYKEWYGVEHADPELLKKAVYGLCELYREDIKKTDIIGNPGCYTTTSILGAAPLVAKKLIDTKTIVIDAKSGVTGAGRKEKLDLSFCECTETMKAYGVATHRHTSEIEQELSLLAGENITLNFTPHLIPMKRGILATIYANLNVEITTEELVNIYKEFYKDEYFVRVYDAGMLPETHHVAGSNFVDIGCVVDKRTNRAIVVSCLDNLYKGAAGQAVQNMNIMYGFDEKTGIGNPGFYL